MKSQVTLKMIAQKLNLSTSTVSRALADQWDVNSQTKKIVTDLAIELNYKPNIMAVKLKQCQKNNSKAEKQPKITIKEIARQLNIAPSTVSRALANKEDISLNTRKKVQALAKKLHYYPNPIAIALKQQHTKRASA